MQQIWPVGVNLERWKLASTKICKFCNNVEDIFRAFAQCKVVNDFVTKLFSYIDPSNIFSHDITIIEFNFGSQNDALNYIFVILKSYIENCRLNGVNFNREAALNQIFRRVLSDKMYTNEQSFYIKWSCFDNLVEESIRCSKQWCLQL